MMNTSGVRLASSTDLTTNVRSEALRRLATKSWRSWLIFVSSVSAVLFLACLLFVPQSYTSAVSLAIAQPTDVTGGLLSSAVGLGSSPNSKYIGVLRSRRFAELVEDRVHLQNLYHMPTRADAVEAIMDNLSVKDSSKVGLIDVSLSLPGPAYLWPGGGSTRERVKQTAAQATNIYSDLLRDYMATSDMDSNAILLKGAQEQIRKVRADYDVAVERLAQLVREQGAHMDAGMTAMGLTTDAGSGATGGASKDFVSLYMQRATLESDIQAATVAMNSLKNQQGNQLRDVNALPTEDPLLMKARFDVSTAQSEVDALRLQYGPDNPKVTVAQDRLHIAQEVLQKQREAIRLQKTSPWIEAKIKLQELETRRSTVMRQIAEEQDKAKIGRDVMTEFERRRGEVMVRLEVLKAASADGAKLSLQTIAASMKLAVVDTGIPARRGVPGPGLMAILSLFLSLLGLSVRVLPQYGKALREVLREGDPVSEMADARHQAA